MSDRKRQKYSRVSYRRHRHRRRRRCRRIAFSSGSIPDIFDLDISRTVNPRALIRSRVRESSRIARGRSLAVVEVASPRLCPGYVYAPRRRPLASNRIYPAALSTWWCIGCYTLARHLTRLGKTTFPTINIATAPRYTHVVRQPMPTTRDGGATASLICGKGDSNRRGCSLKD